MEAVMRRLMYLLAVAVIICTVPVLSQDKRGEYKLESEHINAESAKLDSQIHELNSKIAGLIKKYDLFNNKGIKILPYRFSYKMGKESIEMEHYEFIKDDIYKRTIVGIKSKGLIIYAGGQGVSRLEYKIYENNHLNGLVTEVHIGDPSPDAEGTNDMIFTHIKNGKKILDSKKLGDVKNSTAFPLRNDIKRSFIIPHLSYFYDSILFISESYYKSLKDTDHEMAEFLKKSTKF